MNKLSVRLVLSHIFVAVLGGLATFLVVRALAPALFDASLRRNPEPGSGRGYGGHGPNQALRDQFATAVDQSLLIGSLVGGAAAAVLGVLLARRLIQPLRRMRAATKAMAEGRYDSPVELPHTKEFAELAGDVNKLGRALAETEARRVRLLGEVAHEMRTPLTVIDGYVEAMIDGVMPTTAAELSQVSEEVRRLRRLGEDLSVLSKAEEGRLAIAPIDMDARDVVDAAAERLRPQVDDAGLTLVLRPAQDPLPVRADPDRIAQVVTNLVGNAIRATPEGGSITVSSHRAPGQVLIAVTDTGVGIQGSDLERIFERFYRGPGHTGGRDTGSGIGLTIARGIVSAHHGELTAASAGPGLGATFTVSLPLR